MVLKPLQLAPYYSEEQRSDSEVSYIVELLTSENKPSNSAKDPHFHSLYFSVFVFLVTPTAYDTALSTT